jgi:hypothetical protein
VAKEREFKTMACEQGLNYPMVVCPKIHLYDCTVFHMPVGDFGIFDTFCCHPVVPAVIPTDQQCALDFMPFGLYTGQLYLAS